MRDDQVNRYARHIMLPEIGGLGQTALMVARARLVLRESEPAAELVAGAYLAAGGAGTLVVAASTEAQREYLASRGPDTKVIPDGDGDEVALAPRPPWWPAAEGDAAALAYWRGGLAATEWMARATSR